MEYVADRVDKSTGAVVGAPMPVIEFATSGQENRAASYLALLLRLREEIEWRAAGTKVVAKHTSYEWHIRQERPA